MRKIGIIGGAGYAAGELIRLLLNHPEAELCWVQSESQAGKKLSEVHEGIFSDSDLGFVENGELEQIDTLFMCSGHGKSNEFWKTHQAPKVLQIIDLAQDYRDESDGYIYGLPEWKRSEMNHATKIANPGCFATAIELSLLPLAYNHLLPPEVVVTALTGSTGAGVKPAETTHFSWRNDNVSVYKPFTHQHLLEINRCLAQCQSQNPSHLSFIPMRGPWARGIFASSVMDCPKADVREIFQEFYNGEPFITVCDQPINLKQVVNTNHAVINLTKHEGKLLVTCAIDNLLKGAAGQAVQNFNIMNSYPETMGLKLKASAF